MVVIYAVMFYVTVLAPGAYVWAVRRERRTAVKFLPGGSREC